MGRNNKCLKQAHVTEGIMRKFLNENGFVRIPKRGKHVKAVYCCLRMEVFITFFQNGDWSVSKAGPDGLDDLERWRNMIAEYLKATGRSA